MSLSIRDWSEFATALSLAPSCPWHYHTGVCWKRRETSDSRSGSARGGGRPGLVQWLAGAGIIGATAAFIYQTITGGVERRRGGADK